MSSVFSAIFFYNFRHHCFTTILLLLFCQKARVRDAAATSPPTTQDGSRQLEPSRGRGGWRLLLRPSGQKTLLHLQGRGCSACAAVCRRGSATGVAKVGFGEENSNFFSSKLICTVRKEMKCSGETEILHEFVHDFLIFLYCMNNSSTVVSQFSRYYSFLL